MSLAFALSPPDSIERRVALALGSLVSGAGLGLSAWHCAIGPTLLTANTPHSLRLSLAGLMAAFAVIAVWDGLAGLIGAQRRRALGTARTRGPSARDNAVGRLRVDEGGSAHWRDAGCPAEQAVALSHSLRLPGLIVLVLAPSLPSGLRMPRVRLLLGRSGLGGDAWRSLNAWLTWTERGVRSTDPSPEPSRAHSPTP